MAASPGLTIAALNSLIDTLRGDLTLVSLHTASPGTNGANEVTGGSYTKESETYAAASAGTSDLATPLEFGPMPAVTITHYGLWAGATFKGGNPLSTPRTLLAGDLYTLTSAPITFTPA